MICNNQIFITGGAGFIANAVIGRLINNNQITVYDNFHRDTLSKGPHIGHPNLKIIRGDVLDFDHVCQSMKGANIVIHAAAIA